MKIFIQLLAWSVIAALAGCGSLPSRPDVQSYSAFIDTTQTSLAAIASASLSPSYPSAFRLLPQAGQSFEARQTLISRAEKTIDVQYYLIANDTSGREFLGGLVAAANRGVRVRLLVDDVHTADIDQRLASIARIPNFEVRLFNPFCCARQSIATRIAASILDIGRLNRRMHNKLLIIDGSLAIAGGRNIADEYFARSAAFEFIDIDAIFAGDIVHQLGAIFDRYWTSESAWPAGLILEREFANPVSNAALEEASATSSSSSSSSSSSYPSLDVLGGGVIGSEIEKGKLLLIPGTAYAFADSPAKALARDEEYLQETSVTTQAREALVTAQREVVISSPYLIPREKGMELLTALRESGVDVTIVTNGRSTNDSFFAHLGYAKYRREMVELGVNLYELTANGVGATERAGPGLLRLGSLARLHAKTFVMDRQTVFIGSMNVDPRSADTNTELGILIDSEALANEMLTVIDANRRLGAYRVQIKSDTDETLQWIANDGTSAPINLDTEPNISFFDRLEQFLLFTFVPEEML